MTQKPSESPLGSDDDDDFIVVESGAKNRKLFAFPLVEKRGRVPERGRVRMLGKGPVRAGDVLFWIEGVTIVLGILAWTWVLVTLARHGAL